ncbi:DUF1223 domain-containing protein [Mucilaginibacter agri]|uniref:DUF1223 domain-containing protein n=1 Tax=Mucilaginibacter agri TaxID=2695265 RepID=A0A965ZMW2_9SPHI|nr:DUF1223 domain-containing protein [Mucilaginibacter agri]NCD72497.1 DUF1223 domain-containing protein [Mucilaginibacter agri]
MKMIKLLASCAAAVVLLTSAVYVKHQQFNKSKPVNFDSGKGFAVLELFTSEGCSSCPPADELLEHIQNEVGNQPVYILAYHVDYWNRLGWKDVFSNPDFSKRQYWYNSKFTSQVYTPQLILNGSAEFVGSDETKIRSNLTSALNGKAATSLTLQARRRNGAINIQYQLQGKPVLGQLVVALVQKHAVSQVKAGENEGRRLTHIQIVRNLRKFPITTQGYGNEIIDLPAGFNSREWEVIGFIQSQETGEILSAARAEYSE